MVRKYMYEPINLDHYDLFNKAIGHVDSFRAKRETTIGDIAFIWVAGLGFVGFAEAISKPYVQKDLGDYNYNQLVCDYKICALKFDDPIKISKEEYLELFNGPSAQSVQWMPVVPAKLRESYSELF